MKTNYFVYVSVKYILQIIFHSFVSIYITLHYIFIFIYFQKRYHINSIHIVYNYCDDCIFICNLILYINYI